MDELDDLLRQAAAADRSTRVELFRVRIAAYGRRAIERLAPWLEDAQLGPFAVVTMEHAARHGALKEARTALNAGLGRAREPIASDIKAALGRLGMSRSAGASQSSLGQGYVPTPDTALAELAELVTLWNNEGRPRQPGVPWPRDDWLQAFRAHGPMLRAMPDLLDRAAGAAIGLLATVDARSALGAFIATRAWGDSDNGYGPWRTTQILKFEGAGKALLAVARTLSGEGALAAYRRLADGGDCRLDHLGVAFGTKFLYFCQPDDRRPRALIHDSQMSRWLLVHAGLRLSSSTWSVEKYGRYLTQMHGWAARVGCAPDELEMLIFRSMARPGSNWAW